MLLNPQKPNYDHLDDESKELMLKTIEFFEKKGKAKLKHDYNNVVWYQDFIDFIKEVKGFALMMTPKGYGLENSRWDTNRILAFNEILGFYGLPYWYTWQVSMLGLVPIFISKNEAVKNKAAELLLNGEIFGFGLSEREHGADLISSEMLLSQKNGGYELNGRKYYIGNGNQAAMVSTFAKVKDSKEYAFAVVDSKHENYKLIKNVVHSQNYVAEFELSEYPIHDEDILYRGRDAWDASLSTVAICKYNLGWASVGICTHAFYEVLNHASHRKLFGKYVTEFPHVKALFMDGYARLVAMKAFSERAKDYIRASSAEDRRYLLYNPMVKMKVTMQGEEVINLIWDVMAARGFEKDTYFHMAAIDIRALPKLEGTAHVNMVLVVKFIENMLFKADDSVPYIDKRNGLENDDFVFNQGATTKGLSSIRFDDYTKVLNKYKHLKNVAIFIEQSQVFKDFYAKASPDQAQGKDLDFMLTLGEIFTLIPYAQLILENAEYYDLSDDMIEQIFDFMVRDFGRYALELRNKASTTQDQQEACLKMLRKPSFDQDQFDRVYKREIMARVNSYEMSS